MNKIERRRRQVAAIIAEALGPQTELKRDWLYTERANAADALVDDPSRTNLSWLLDVISRLKQLPPGGI
jgi:hypothetical protein